MPMLSLASAAVLLTCCFLIPYAGPSVPAVANPEDIDLDEGDAEEEAEEAGANIQLETKPVPVRVMLLVVSRRKFS